ncbi:type I restriction modification DNA specificity domain protein [Paenibacillus sp. oral taxon 786 str. D14]|uniref:restriction endonuclease subunit S n=1 Tax=Paenibacillus sp. oral taxon 786 TaxID=652715 RepID=UPI0001AFD667|nr:restriction endonuclease subunit S [Paenibacillus sp. oral taxon 786]EES71713.1 type I restriction modification DNA specificity domain protein [Paenibacillus sp. oral taxon 786 str. D14]
MVVPNGWAVKPLLECCDLLQGLTYSPSNIQSYGLLVLRSSNIQDGKLVLDDCVYVNCSIDEIKYVKPNDILICVRNGSSALIGKSCVIDRPYNATFGAFMSVLRGDTTGYLAHMFASDVVQQQIRNRSSATINQITKRDFEDIKIPIPFDEEEQRAIAAALSDADAYITALEKLITKKRAVKQGAMQELLTGKRRLPGFKGEWIEKKIHEIGDTSSGGTPSRSVPTYFNGNIPWVTTSELNDNYIRSTAEKITSEALNNSSAKLFPKGTVLMAMYGATIGKLGILDVDATTNQACCALFFNKDIDSVFMYFLLLYHRTEIIELGSGAGQPNISQMIIRNLTFTIPPTLAEQTAIAAVLSDMDAEIDALTAKLEKARRIKQGMMSELLTGRIRLVEGDVDNGEN